MSVIDYILDGLEAELALQRELGIRFVECDRSVLKVSAPVKKVPPQEPPQVSPAGELAPPSLGLSSPPPPPTPLTPTHPFLFLHHRPLSPAGVEMISKIVSALGFAPEAIPVVSDKPVPKAQVYVILGGLALKKFQPNLKGVPGEWLKTEKGADILVTYSPEYILRFKEVSPGIKQIKTEMWQALKGVVRRLHS